MLDKNDDFKDFIGKDTKVEVEMLGDPELRKLKKGDIVQIQRRGFFIVDSPYKDPTPNSCKAASIRLIAIPDGTSASYGVPGKAAAAPQPAAQPAAKSGPKKAEASAKAKVESKPAPVAASGDELNAAIIAQGDKVRQLKTDKADKATIDAAVAALLDLKAKYKAATGKDWKPGQAAPAAKSATSPASVDSNADQLNAEITAQGDKVRQLKADKADKATVDAAVAALLDLKAKYKAATGKDWKPGQAAPAAKPAAQLSASSASTGSNEDKLNADITAQGDKVRQLKADKADKPTVDAAVAKLLELKAAYKAASGKDWKPSSQPAPKAAKEPSPPKAAEQASNPVADQLSADIVVQGDKVRQLKTDKADKVAVDTAVNVLLGLKAKYKTLTGNDWKPPAGNPGTV